jgi:hypothetical protein
MQLQGMATDAIEAAKLNIQKEDLRGKYILIQEALPKWWKDGKLDLFLSGTRQMNDYCYTQAYNILKKERAKLLVKLTERFIRENKMRLD